MTKLWLWFYRSMTVLVLLFTYILVKAHLAGDFAKTLVSAFAILSILVSMIGVRLGLICSQIMESDNKNPRS